MRGMFWILLCVTALAGSAAGAAPTPESTPPAAATPDALPLDHRGYFTAAWPEALKAMPGTDLYRSTLGFLPDTLTLHPDNQLQIVVGIGILSHALHRWNPTEGVVEIAAALHDGMMKRGVIDGLVFPTLQAIDAATQAGRTDFAGILSLALFKFNPPMAEHLSNQLDLPRAAPPRIQARAEQLLLLGKNPFVAVQDWAADLGIPGQPVTSEQPPTAAPPMPPTVEMPQQQVFRIVNGPGAFPWKPNAPAPSQDDKRREPPTPPDDSVQRDDALVERKRNIDLQSSGSTGALSGQPRVSSYEDCRDTCIVNGIWSGSQAAGGVVSVGAIVGSSLASKVPPAALVTFTGLAGASIYIAGTAATALVFGSIIGVNEYNSCMMRDCEERKKKSEPKEDQEPPSTTVYDENGIVIDCVKQKNEKCVDQVTDEKGNVIDCSTQSHANCPKTDVRITEVKKEVEQPENKPATAAKPCEMRPDLPACAEALDREFCSANPTMPSCAWQTYAALINPAINCPQDSDPAICGQPRQQPPPDNTTNGIVTPNPTIYCVDGSRATPCQEVTGTPPRQQTAGIVEPKPAIYCTPDSQAGPCRQVTGYTPPKPPVLADPAGGVVEPPPSVAKPPPPPAAVPPPPQQMTMLRLPPDGWAPPSFAEDRDGLPNAPTFSGKVFSDEEIPLNSAPRAKDGRAFCTETWRRGTTTQVNTLDPHKATGRQERDILGDIAMGLFYLDADMQVRPGLAQSISVNTSFNGSYSVNGQGITGYVYEFKLRQDAFWASGRPITAHDFVATFERLTSASTRSPLRHLLAGVTLVAATGDHTLAMVVSLDYPRPDLLQALADPATVPLPAALLLNDDEETRKALELGTYGSNGRYRVVHHEPGRLVKLKANTDFYESNVPGTLARVVEYLKLPRGDVASIMATGELDFGVSQYESNWHVAFGNGDKTGIVVQDLPSTCFLTSDRALDAVADRAALYERLQAFTRAVPFQGEYQEAAARIAEITGRPEAVEWRRIIDGGAWQAPPPHAGNALKYDSDSQTLAPAMKQWIQEPAVVWVADREENALAIAQHLKSYWDKIVKQNGKVKIEKYREESEVGRNEPNERRSPLHFRFMCTSTRLNLAEDYVLAAARGLIDQAAREAMVDQVNRIKIQFDPGAKQRYLQQLEKYMIEKAFVIPLYTPKTLLYYSKKVDNGSATLAFVVRKGNDYSASRLSCR